MMLLNRKKRLKYLGFNDIVFMVLGILLLSIVTDYIFENSFARYPFPRAVVSWSVSLVFAFLDWTIIRRIMIALRKKYPQLKDDKKRLFLLFLTIIGVVIGIDTLGGLVISLIFDTPFYYPNRFQVQLPIILISTMTMAIYEAIYYNVRLKKSILQQEQSKQAIVQAELDALSNRAQPHFFFNSLNTLRDIIDYNSKEDAKLFVDKLSDVYRFILKVGKEHSIPIKEEVDFAKAYIHVQSERFGDNLVVQWDLSIQTRQRYCMPTSLQLLIENAIKHNIISKSKPLLIKIFEARDKIIVENQLQPKSSKIPSTQIGLKNLKARYALMTKVPVIIENNEYHFRVSLPLLNQEKKYENTDY
ncbi:MAG: sensor histidine kinase [Croceivirga sp.]